MDRDHIRLIGPSAGKTAQMSAAQNLSALGWREFVNEHVQASSRTTAPLILGRVYPGRSRFDPTCEIFLTRSKIPAVLPVRVKAVDENVLWRWRAGTGTHFAIWTVSGAMMDVSIRKILVPVDFSAASERAATYAVALARRLGASLHLVHALQPPTLSEFDDIPSAEMLDDVFWTARTRLSSLSRRLGHGEQTTSEVRYGPPSDAVTAAAIRYGADLVIMSTRHQGDVSHLTMESVADRVLRSTECPVLIIRDCGQVHVHRPTSSQPAKAGDMSRAS
jgi:nucleotide-binding universal stress UspA family protein